MRAKAVLFLQSGFIWDKFVVLGKNFVVSGCSPVKVVVFGQKWLYLGKVVVFWRKWFHSGKVVVFGQKWCY